MTTPQSTSTGNDKPFLLPLNVRVLVFLVSLPGLVLVAMMLFRFIRDGLQADLSWAALIYGSVSALLLRLVYKGHW